MLLFYVLCNDFTLHDSRHLALVFRDIHHAIALLFQLQLFYFQLQLFYFQDNIFGRKLANYFANRRIISRNTIVPYERLISSSSRDQLTFAIYSVIR